MKPLAIYLFLFGFACSADGQTNHFPSGQMYQNHIYFCGHDSLAALEQNTARMESKTKALGFGGSEGGFVMDGEKSAIRFKSSDTIRFAVKIAVAMADPTMMIRLYKFDSKKGSRVAIISSSGSAYSKGKNTGNANEINFNVQKETDDFILIPASRLVPGEYGFLNMMMVKASDSRNMSYTVFAFGVD